MGDKNIAFLTISLPYASVESMDTHVDPNSPSDVKAEIPVVSTNPPKQSSKKNIRLVSVVLIIIIVTITIVVVLYRSSQPQKSDNTTAPASQTPSVNLKADYKNPFDRSAQYENPFENLE